MTLAFVLGVLFGFMLMLIMFTIGISEFLMYFQVDTIILDFNETEVAEAVFRIVKDDLNVSEDVIQEYRAQKGE